VQAAGTLRNVNVSEVGVVGGVAINEIDLRGYGVSGAGGVQLHITPAIAFQIDALVSWGNLTKGSVDGVDVSGFDISVLATRINLGAVWWPVG